ESLGVPAMSAESIGAESIGVPLRLAESIGELPRPAEAVGIPSSAMSITVCPASELGSVQPKPRIAAIAVHQSESGRMSESAAEPTAKAPTPTDASALVECA